MLPLWSLVNGAALFPGTFYEGQGKEDLTEDKMKDHENQQERKQQCCLFC